MNAPTNIYQLRSPAGHPDIPYRPSCFQIEPQQGSVEGWIAWGPVINGQHQNWLGLPQNLDIAQVYDTLDAYGLCVKGGDEVPFVAVDNSTQETKTEQPSMPEPLRLLAEGANVEQPNPATNSVNPNLARLAPVETQAAEEQPVDVRPAVQQPGGMGWMTFWGIAGVVVAAIGYQQWEAQVNVQADISEPEQEPADVSLAHSPVRPAVSAHIRPESLDQQGVSTPETTKVSTYETPRNLIFESAKQVLPFPETKSFASRNSETALTTDRNRQMAMQLVRQHLSDMYEISETVDAEGVSQSEQKSFESPESTKLKEKYFQLRKGGLNTKKDLALVLFDAKPGNNSAWSEASDFLDQWKIEWETINA